MPASGKKNAIVTIFQKTETPDADYNTPVYTLVAWRTNIFCVMVARRGKEIEIEGQVVAESYYRLEFDYFDVVGINELMVVRHEGVDYDIRAILPDTSMKQWIAIEMLTRPIPTGRA